MVASAIPQNLVVRREKRNHACSVSLTVFYTLSLRLCSLFYNSVGSPFFLLPFYPFYGELNRLKYIKKIVECLFTKKTKNPECLALFWQEREFGCCKFNYMNVRELFLLLKTIIYA